MNTSHARTSAGGSLDALGTPSLIYGRPPARDVVLTLI